MTDNESKWDDRPLPETKEESQRVVREGVKELERAQKELGGLNRYIARVKDNMSIKGWFGK